MSYILATIWIAIVVVGFVPPSTWRKVYGWLQSRIRKPAAPAPALEPDPAREDLLKVLGMMHEAGLDALAATPWWNAMSAQQKMWYADHAWYEGRA